MTTPRTNRTFMGAARQKPASTASALIARILNSASQGALLQKFLREVSREIVKFVGCNSVEIRIVERTKLVICEATLLGEGPTHREAPIARQDEKGQNIPCLSVDSDVERVCEEIALRRFDPSLPFFTEYGSFWIGDSDQYLDLGSESCKWAGGRTLRIGGAFKSLLIVPFKMETGDRGLILFKDKRRDFFTADDVPLHEYLAQMLGVASTQRRVQVALRERVKELSCLYGIARVAAKSKTPLDDMLDECVQLLPPGWLHVDVASACIQFDGHSYSTPNFRAGHFSQTADIVVRGRQRGMVTIAYIEERPPLDEGPFLREERHLLNAVAHELALLIEAREMADGQLRLQEQLRHADRLATIGQLAAGVAHELNEPLAAILGLAQLDARIPGLPEQVRKDNEKIVAASLHAREIINKLRLFARQSPPKTGRVNINDIVSEGLYFLEARCAKAGIGLVKELDLDLPEIQADAGQLYQVLVNLVVNAIQATPEGGRVTIRTLRREGGMRLKVEDTGTGMEDGILKRIFDPFFTTKGVDEGTGLGLSVVHGIVESHGGAITVASKPGVGTSFEISLPLSAPCNIPGKS